MRWLLAQIFAGGRNWSALLALTKTLANVRGGLEIPLLRSAAGGPGFGMSNGVFRVKFMLEVLAVYDIFGGYAHGRVGGGRVHSPPFPT